MSIQRENYIEVDEPVRVVPEPVVPVATQPVVPAAVAQPVVYETAAPVAAQTTRTTAGRWYAPDSFITGIAGVGLLIVGLIAITRAGLDGPMNQPVVDVLGFHHTVSLGLIEAGFGIVFLLSAAARSRGAAAFFAILMGVGAIVAAVQEDSFRDNLAIESGWAWLMVVVAAVILLASLLLPRYATATSRVATERVVR